MKVELIKPTGRWRVFRRPKFKLIASIFVCGYEIPAGFISDGATLPPVVRSIFDPMGVWAEAAFLHDFLLRDRSRAFAAAEFYRAMDAFNVPPVVRDLFFVAVRAYDFYVELVR